MQLRPIHRLLGLLGFVALLPGGAAAQNLGVLNWTPGNFAVTDARVGLGLGFAPDYRGSDDLVVVPLPSFSFSLGKIPIKNNQLGLEVNIRPGFAEPAGGDILAYGPILRYDLGRNDGSKVDDPIVALTTPVKSSFELGGFVEATVPLGASGGAPTLLTARLSVVQGLNGGHEGALAEASIGVVKPLGRWTIGAGLGTSAASDGYTRAYFGVSPGDAAKTGLAAYQPSGGFLDVGVSLFASYDVTDHWSVDALAGYTILLGDAADSPLVKDRGRAEQPFAGLGLTYRF